MTSNDIERLLIKNGFHHDTTLTYKLHDCRVFIHNDKISITDSVSKLINISIDDIILFDIDILAMLLIIETKELYNSFILF